MALRAPNPPRGTGKAGAALWRAVLAEYELQEHEMLLLREAVRTVDVLDDLAARVAKDGTVVGSSQGDRAPCARGGTAAADCARAFSRLSDCRPARSPRRAPTAAGSVGWECVAFTR